MAVDGKCLHEEQIQGQSRKITELETRADYKEKRIDDLYSQMEKMDNKLDVLLDGFNEFKLQSNHYDSELELRLKAIETRIDLQEKSNKDNLDRYKLWLAIVTVVFGILTFYFNFVR